jgi:cytidylate kinase
MSEKGTELGTVTIAASYGAGGSVVAPAVAERLGLPFVGRAIPVELAEQLHHPLMTALADEERHDHSVVRHLFDRALAYSGLFVGAPTPLDHLGVDEQVAAGEAAIRRQAEGDGAVILGRAAVFVLKDRPAVLHVRLGGSVEARRRQAVNHERLDYETACRLQQQTDRARAAYVDHYHAQEGAWEDPKHYHLIIDSTAISLDTCVELITMAAKDLFSSRPPGKTAPKGS